MIDIDTPMNSAKETNLVFGPISLYSGRATAMPSSIGSATLALEIVSACSALPLSCSGSSSSPTRNM